MFHNCAHITRCIVVCGTRIQYFVYNIQSWIYYSCLWFSDVLLNVQKNRVPFLAAALYVPGRFWLARRFDSCRRRSHLSETGSLSPHPPDTPSILCKRSCRHTYTNRLYQPTVIITEIDGQQLHWFQVIRLECINLEIIFAFELSEPAATLNLFQSKSFNQF